MTSLKFTGFQLTQGDVNLREIEALPEDKNLTEVTSKIVQPSETHGKAHKFNKTDTQAKVYDAGEEGTGGTITPNTQKFIVVDSEGALLFHGKEFETMPNKDTLTDHSALVVPPGIYYVDIAREFDYDTLEERRVVD